MHQGGVKNANFFNSKGVQRSRFMDSIIGERRVDDELQ